MGQREQWGTRAGFILAAVGSAVGLGNIWRFPYVAYDNGGGAFFIPYLFALLTAGIPLLIMEFTIGHKYRGSAPLSYSRLSKKTEWIGWWQVAVSFVTSMYYSVIIAWAIAYTIFSLKLQWGKDPEAFLFGDFLQLADKPGTIGSLVPSVLVPLLFVWGFVLLVLVKGVKKGVEKVNRIFIPLLVGMFLIIVIRAVTLEGATVGLNALFQPNWDRIFDSKVWVAAYTQIFFSLSIGLAIMIIFSSYVPKKSDITNNAFITAFANSGFELLAGIGVFSAIGFMAVSSGVKVEEVATAGVGLAFVVFPKIISTFPAFNGFFGFLFFGSLVIAGLTSLLSLVEAFVSAVQEKFQISRTKAVLIGGGITSIGSLLFATNGGLYFLDIVDHFISNYGIALSGLVASVTVYWVLRKGDTLLNHANEVSDIQVGKWWKLCVGYITPFVLGTMMYQNIVKDVKEGYEGYPSELLFNAGWGVSIAIFVLSFVFMSRKWKEGVRNDG